jgi:predicted O-methyltransferase YrrM
MKITNLFLDKDPTLVLHNEGDWSNTELEYLAFNSGGVECEVGEFLYGLVRILKPDHVLETGLHHGIGAMYMGEALKDNGKGNLDTIEFLPEIKDIADTRISMLELEDWITTHLIDARAFEPGDKKYKLIFLDTEPETRFGELLKFYPYLEDGGYLLIHDTPRSLCQGNVNPDHPLKPSWPFGDVPEEMKAMLKDGRLVKTNFPSPRGLTLFYKKHNDDYQV